MELNEYQDLARATAIYPDKGSNLIYPALKLAGEAGEVAEKIGKLMRDRSYSIGSEWRVTNSECLPGITASAFGQIEDELIKELGDVLWYIAALACELGINLDYVAKANLNKLADRASRGKLQGNGDNR